MASEKMALRQRKRALRPSEENRRDALPDSVLPRGGISLNLKYRLVLSQFFGNLTKSITFRSRSVQSHKPDKLHNPAKVSSFKLYNS